MGELDSHFLKMEKEEINNIEETQKIYGKNISSFIKSINKCEEVIGSIFEEEISNKKLSYGETSSAMIMPRLFTSIKSIYNLVIEGYYYDALVLVRSWFECLGLFIYLSKNEEEAHKWVLGKKIDISYIALMKEITDILSGNGDKSFFSIYGRLSQYIHNLSIAIYSIIKDHSKNHVNGGVEYHVRLVPTFNERDVYESLVFHLPVFLLMSLNEIFSLKIVSEIYEYAKEAAQRP